MKKPKRKIGSDRKSVDEKLLPRRMQTVFRAVEETDEVPFDEDDEISFDAEEEEETQKRRQRKR